MKTTSCAKCRKRIHEEETEIFAKKEYAILKDAVHTFAKYATVAVLAVQVQRGRSKEYIQKLYDDMVAIYDMPELFGKQITLTDLIQRLEKEYGLDFGRINVHIETEQEFVKDLKTK